MKIKKFNKKLALNKKTIVRLDNQAMKNLKAGYFTESLCYQTDYSCYQICWAYATNEFNTCDCSNYLC